MTVKINGDDTLTIKTQVVHSFYTNHRLRYFINTRFENPDTRHKIWVLISKVRRRFRWLDNKLRGELVYRQVEG